MLAIDQKINAQFAQHFLRAIDFIEDIGVRFDAANVGSFLVPCDYGGLIKVDIFHQRYWGYVPFIIFRAAFSTILPLKSCLISTLSISF